MRLMNLFLVLFLAFVGSCKVAQETKTKNIDSAQDRRGRHLNVNIDANVSIDKCLSSQGILQLSFYDINIKGEVYLQENLTDCELDVRRKIGSKDGGRFKVEVTDLVPAVSSYFCGKEIAPHLDSKLGQVVLCQEARNAIGNFLSALLATKYSVLDANDPNLKEYEKSIIIGHTKNKTIVEECFQPAFISTDNIPANHAELIKKYPNNSACSATLSPIRAWLTFIYAHTNALTDLFVEFAQDPLLKAASIHHDTAKHWYLPRNRDYYNHKFRKLFMYPSTLDNRGKVIHNELTEDKYLSESYELVRGFVKEVSGRYASPQSVGDIRKDIAPYLDAFSQPKHYYSRAHVNAFDSVIFVVPLEDVETLLRKINTKISRELVQSTSLSDSDKDTLQRDIITKTAQKIDAHLEKIKKSRRIVEKVIVSYKPH